MISAEGVTSSPKHIEAVNKQPSNKFSNINQAQQFLGLINYFRKLTVARLVEKISSFLFQQVLYKSLRIIKKGAYVLSHTAIVWSRKNRVALRCM